MVRKEKIAPLIVTLRLKDKHQQFFDALRDEHFPSHINYLHAHITLFHHLPSDEPAIIEKLKAVARHRPIQLRVHEVSYLGNGVAYSLESEELQLLHSDMQETFQEWLNFKDQQILWPHITIQNRTTTFKAQQLYERLNQDFIPFDVEANGLCTWLYLKGPWKQVDTFPFNPPSL